MLSRVSALGEADRMIATGKKSFFSMITFTQAEISVLGTRLKEIVAAE
jgi:hypothetical protein